MGDKHSVGVGQIEVELQAAAVSMAERTFRQRGDRKFESRKHKLLNEMLVLRQQSSASFSAEG